MNKQKHWTVIYKHFRNPTKHDQTWVLHIHSYTNLSDYLHWSRTTCGFMYIQVWRYDLQTWVQMIYPARDLVPGYQGYKLSNIWNGQSEISRWRVVSIFTTPKLGFRIFCPGSREHLLRKAMFLDGQRVNLWFPQCSLKSVSCETHLISSWWAPAT